MLYAAALALGYAFGSIPFSYVLARLAGGPDPRTVGSRNLGSANVFIHISKAAGICAGLLDVGKGLAAGLLAMYLLDVDAGYAGGLAGLGAVAGHIWPIWLGFRGGKGGGAAIGGLSAMIPAALWLSIGVHVVQLVVFRLLGVPRRIATVPFGIATGLAAPLVALWLGVPVTTAFMCYPMMALAVGRTAVIHALRGGKRPVASEDAPA
jgi:glycerol-3-phosphate acyltransferase PlsY